jgi:hypothetical protein
MDKSEIIEGIVKVQRSLDQITSRINNLPDVVLMSKLYNSGKRLSNMALDIETEKTKKEF